MAIFETDQQVLTALLNIATDEGQTANALAKAIGYNKCNDRVKRVLTSMVKEKSLKESTNARGFTIYSLVSSTTVASDTTTESASVTAPDPVEEVPVPGYTLPKEKYGYDIKAATDGRFAFDISMPDGKELQLTKSERLFIINQDPNYRFIVEDPEDILTAIGTFTQEAGYAHFLVKDLASSKHIKSPADLGTDVALFVTISRHNKAGDRVTEVRSRAMVGWIKHTSIDFSIEVEVGAPFRTPKSPRRI